MERLSKCILGIKHAIDAFVILFLESYLEYFTTCCYLVDREF